MNARPLRFFALVAALEHLGGGAPRYRLTPQNARQFIFPNGMILRFDLALGQYAPQQGPHINLEMADGRNYHLYLR